MNALNAQREELQLLQRHLPWGRGIVGRASARIAQCRKIHSLAVLASRYWPAATVAELD
ncbi:MAG TPA: hypothetical protein VNY24_18680 [Candidatus Acidoferrales bacterium]|nr:hypothetical protein [Candidatus Acidoferrales bacterium]